MSSLSRAANHAKPSLLDGLGSSYTWDYEIGKGTLISSESFKDFKYLTINPRQPIPSNYDVLFVKETEEVILLGDVVDRIGIPNYQETRIVKVAKNQCKISRGVKVIAASGVVTLSGREDIFETFCALEPIQFSVDRIIFPGVKEGNSKITFSISTGLQVGDIISSEGLEFRIQGIGLENGFKVSFCALLGEPA